MPTSKVWPTPLRVGTGVEIRSDGGEKFTGVICGVLQWGDTWLYQIEGHVQKYTARRVRPLDLSDPSDVEVFLNG